MQPLCSRFKTFLSITALAAAVSPAAFAQGAGPPDPSAWLQQLRPDVLMAQQQAGTLQSPWQDISRAPSDFPVALYRGRETKFMTLAPVDDLMRATGTARQITLTTKDSPDSVVSWYQSALPAAGLKLDSKYGLIDSGSRKMLRAASDTVNCIVTVTGRDDGASPESTIQITVSKKQKILL